MKRKTWQITAPHFVAGLRAEANHVIELAPIIRYMKPWSLGYVKQYCQRKGWKIEEVKEKVTNDAQED